jgi:phosphohistidine phosphatase
MDLIFWRHAEAEDERDGQSDLERELTARGQKQAARMAAWLDRHLPEGTRILCSPAVRCEQTVLALGRKYKLRHELQPGAAPAELLELAQWPRAKHPVMIVGHQPALGETLAQLLRVEGGECTIRKGAVWWLRTREREQGDQTLVWAVVCPEVA